MPHGPEEWLPDHQTHSHSVGASPGSQVRDKCRAVKDEDQHIVGNATALSYYGTKELQVVRDFR